MVLVWVVPTADCKKLKESRLEVCMLGLSSEIRYKPQMPPRRQVTPPPPPPLSSSEQVLAGLAQILRQNAGTSQDARTEMPYEKFRKMGPPEFTCTTDPFVAEGRVRTLETIFRYMRLEDAARYGPFNPYIPIRSTTIGKSRVAKDPIVMHTSWRSNSEIASVTRTNQYNQDLGLIHSTNGNHLESPNEGSSIDHQVTIYLHAQNITMFPTNETWYFASQILVSSSGGLILILTVQSTRN
ncbi:hypothetical protein F511_18596 [Dorcoceras hygrometricum]|uniref:Uncharacterized protein n=1 Tax=Dorcoceras hygrometricum TaxID=472368 RepID=A0A2Z7A346_9LAMI|nr:hypothetical protein F511_18596 [Dorcoceras hygrometricum]